MDHMHPLRTYDITTAKQSISTNVNIWGALYFSPVPLSIFRSNSKFDENSKHSGVKYTDGRQADNDRVFQSSGEGAGRSHEELRH